MNEKTDAPPLSAASPAPPARKPRFALFVATACGLGYIPFAPGTWGSFAGLVLATLPFSFALSLVTDIHVNRRTSSMGYDVDPILFLQCLITVAVAIAGLWSASRAADYWRQKDPQKVVIDEVSGQHLTLLLGLGVPVWWRGLVAASPFPRFFSFRVGLGWKYLLLGLILFRLFDIWKPFPVRQAESLPGGWGIMADDWVAAVYAGLGLWIARAAGL
jgi:phosphatidylglycerophosphatase A